MFGADVPGAELLPLAMTAATPATPMRLSMVASSMQIPLEPLRALVHGLGGELEDITLTDFLSVQEADIMKLLEDLEVDGVHITPLGKGALIWQVQSLAKVGGCQPPGSGKFCAHHHGQNFI